jgi:hypothetical protein
VTNFSGEFLIKGSLGKAKIGWEYEVKIDLRDIDRALSGRQYWLKIMSEDRPWY